MVMCSAFTASACASFDASPCVRIALAVAAHLASIYSHSAATWGAAFKHYFPRYSARGVMQAFFALNVPFMLPVLEFADDEFFKARARFCSPSVSLLPRAPAWPKFGVSPQLLYVCLSCLLLCVARTERQPISRVHATIRAQIVGDQRNVAVFRPRSWRGTSGDPNPIIHKNYLTVAQASACAVLAAALFVASSAAVRGLREPACFTRLRACACCLCGCCLCASCACVVLLL